MIKTRIEDGCGSGRQAEVHKSNGDQGLKVFSEPLRVWINDNQFATNTDYGIELAQDASSGGTPLPVFDGNDTALWTGTNVVGTGCDFSNTTRPRTGSQSAEWDNPNLNDVIQFDKGSNQDLTNYVSLTIWVNVDRRWAANNEGYTVFGYDTNTSSVIGNTVRLDDYIIPNNFDVWQLATIPLDDMGLTNQTIDAFRIEFIQQNNTSPRIYLDDIDLQESGPPVDFLIEPDSDKLLSVSALHFTFIDAYAGTLLNNSTSNLSYDQILGLPSLSAGVKLARVIDGEVIFSTTFKNLGELLRISGQIQDFASDGTNSILTVRITFNSPIELRSSDNDYISVTINDDLTGLTSFNVFALASSREVHA